MPPSIVPPAVVLVLDFRFLITKTGDGDEDKII
jgi:hypothetical protein